VPGPTDWQALTAFRFGRASNLRIWPLQNIEYFSPILKTFLNPPASLARALLSLFLTRKAALVGAMLVLAVVTRLWSWALG
jgi:hypothetical protein